MSSAYSFTVSIASKQHALFFDSIQVFSAQELQLLREHRSRPALEQLHAYMLAIQDEVLPGSEAGPAVSYTSKNWTALTRYCANADLSIDNNATERALRYVAVGRANGTFFGSDRGGRTARV
jgi:transposase